MWVNLFLLLGNNICFCCLFCQSFLMNTLLLLKILLLAIFLLTKIFLSFCITLCLSFSLLLTLHLQINLFWFLVIGCTTIHDVVICHKAFVILLGIEQQPATMSFCSLYKVFLTILQLGNITTMPVYFVKFL